MTLKTQFAQRAAFDWKLRRRSLALGARTLVMGVLNVTPDSFSDGGEFLDTNAAVDQALRMLDEGAAMIDVGGESTRPGKGATETAQQEQARVMPVIERLLRLRPETILSIDTYKAETARLAVDAGAEIVNDISGLMWDGAMAAACAELKCGVVLMHTRGRPAEWRLLPKLETDEVVTVVMDGLRVSLAAARGAGIDDAQVVVDPGYGFGKSFEENYPLVARLSELQALGRPMLAGSSRKSFLGRTAGRVTGGTDLPVAERQNASIAAMTATILAGAHIVRVHDVRPAVEAAAIADAILEAAI